MTAPNPAPEAATAPEQAPVVPPQVENPPGAEHLGDAGKRALDTMKAERQAEKARADGLAARLQEIEDRDKSELQKAQDAAARTAEELAAVRRENALLSKGISSELAPPAPTAPAEEWTAYADRLLAWKGTAPAVPALPRPDAGQGVVTPPASAADADYAAWKQSAFPTTNR